MTAFWRNASRWVIGPVAFLAGFGLLLGPATAQESKPKVPAADAATGSEWQVLQLRNSAAADVALLLQNLLGGDPRGATIRVVPDTRSNALVVSAAPAELARVKEILTKVDAPEPVAEPARLRVIQLRSIEPDNAVAEALGLVFRGRDGSFAL